MENNFLSNILNQPSLEIIEILDSNLDRCYFTILAKFFNEENKLDENIIFKIKKKEFSYESHNIEEIKKNLKHLLQDNSLIFKNDVYYKFLTTSTIENNLKLDFIYPANSKIIDKYRKKETILFTENINIYMNKTRPYIYSIDPSHTKWIENILYNKAEEIFFEEENSFVIIQDYNSKDNPSIINFLGIPFRNDIKSLRDLNESHLHLLEKFYTTGRLEISKKYGIAENQVRCFIHYPPTFYYLHVHYLLVDYESSSTSINRAHDLFGIIENIKMKNDYYQSVNLELVLNKDSKLYETLNAKITSSSDSP